MKDVVPGHYNFQRSVHHLQGMEGNTNKLFA